MPQRPPSVDRMPLSHQVEKPQLHPTSKTPLTLFSEAVLAAAYHLRKSSPHSASYCAAASSQPQWLTVAYVSFSLLDVGVVDQRRCLQVSHLRALGHPGESTSLYARFPCVFTSRAAPVDGVVVLSLQSGRWRGGTNLAVVVPEVACWHHVSILDGAHHDLTKRGPKAAREPVG